MQDFFRSMEENREQLFLRLSPWEKITLASALVPFSPEKISVIAQNHQRLFRDVIGHRTKNSILKAIQDAELTSAQIIEFAAALDRNRDSLLPEDMWEDVQVPIIREMAPYTGRQIDFIARCSSGRLVNFLGVGGIGVTVRFALINTATKMARFIN